MWQRIIFLTSIAILLGATLAGAAATRVAVRVKSKDAKFIGTSMGGAQVTIRNADTGELLAQGVTAGGTGNTDRIMREPHARNSVLADESAARFVAELDLAVPTRLEVRVFGPLAQRQAAGAASVTLWAIPGRHLDGSDGVLLELPGFAVDILSPPVHRQLARESLPIRLDLKANVVMMCGCPLTKGGLWDATKIEVRALVRRGAVPAGEVPLVFTGETSQFGGSLELTAPGPYEITVYAFDPATGNTGVDMTTVLVQ